MEKRASGRPWGGRTSTLFLKVRSGRCVGHSCWEQGLEFMTQFYVCSVMLRPHPKLRTDLTHTLKAGSILWAVFISVTKVLKIPSI